MKSRPLIRQVLIPGLLIALLAGCNDSDNSNISLSGGASSGNSSQPIDSSQCAANAAAAEDFYLPPDPLPQGQPGDVIRCQPIQTLLSIMGSTTLVMYLSTDAHGDPIAVTGVVIEPHMPWSGDGVRPLVGFTDGTYGQGDQCASSKLMAEVLHYSPLLDGMIAYESLVVGDLLLRGFAVTVTDYARFGTPGAHTWLNRLEQAQANMDIVRAARRLPDTTIAPEAPVGFMGYSQGGSAAAGTAELLASYAPELDVVGIYAGAAPASPAETLGFNDGSSLMGAAGYYLNGLAAAYPEVQGVIDAALNEKGKAMLAATSEQCVFETILTFGFQQSSSMTHSGQTLSELMNGPDLYEYTSKDHLGSVAPYVPVLLGIGVNDDIVPVEGVRRLAEDWCALGAEVEYFELPLPLLPGPATAVGHIANMPLLYLGKAGQWLSDRFAGKAFSGTCP